jgi:hypothetical protein
MTGVIESHRANADGVVRILLKDCIILGTTRSSWIPNLELHMDIFRNRCCFCYVYYRLDVANAKCLLNEQTTMGSVQTLCYTPTFFLISGVACCMRIHAKSPLQAISPLIFS